MSFRTEVRKFMAEMRGEAAAVKVLEKQLLLLRKHNELLMDRLMSKNLGDYKIHTIELPRGGQQSMLPFDMDETNAGEMVEGLE